jgi:hypothetical protein
MQLSDEDVQRLVDGLRATLSFIENNIPPDVIAAKQTYGLEKTRAALRLKPTTAKNLSQMSIALFWAVGFVQDNYQGNADEIADAVLLLAETGWLDFEPVAIH